MLMAAEVVYIDPNQNKSELISEEQEKNPRGRRPPSADGRRPTADAEAV